jgi:hypothetical protein
VWGPEEPGGEPVAGQVEVRRYRCQACGATCTVVPWEVVARRRYTVAAVVWALALWGLVGWSLAQVRKGCSPWRVWGDSGAGRWRTVLGWVEAVREGRLLARVRPWPEEWPPRRAAAHVGSAVAGWAPVGAAPGPPLAVQSFWGAGFAA